MDGGPGLLVGRVVVFQTSRLQEAERDFGKGCKVFASNQWTGDEGNEDHQHDEVEDRETDHSSLSKLGLLERIDRRTDLTTIYSLVRQQQ